MKQPNLAPLVIHHAGFQPHLPFCLWQNRRTNPRRQIIFLGDASNRVRGIEYQHEDAEEDQKKNLIFHASYRHVTESEFRKTRSHLERWFRISSFLERSGIDRFYFLDSDYLLFCDLSQHEAKWLAHPAVGTPSLWGFCYLRSASIVHRFCEWLMELYRDEVRFGAMLARYQGIGLGDMSLLLEYCQDEKLDVTKMDWEHSTERECFDDCYYGCSYFDHTRDFDRLRQDRPGGPVHLQAEGGTRRLLGLHFQGHRKRQIPGFTGWDPAVLRAFFRPNLRRNLRHLLQYFWEGRRCRRLLGRPPERVPGFSRE